MAGAIIVVDQPGGAGAGSPGVARNDLWQLQQVNLSCASVNSHYQWDLLDAPPGSGTELEGGGTSTPHFVPDLIGTYRIQLVTNGGGPGNVQILVVRVRFDNVGVLQNRGWAPPAFGEQSGESNYGGNIRGWAEEVEFILADIRSSLTTLETSGGGSSTLQFEGDTFLHLGLEEIDAFQVPTTYLGMPAAPAALLFVADIAGAAVIGFQARPSGDGIHMEINGQVALDGVGGSIQMVAGAGVGGNGRLTLASATTELARLYDGIITIGDAINDASASINLMGPSDTAVGLAGGADALPATPALYLEVLYKGLPYVMPLFLKPGV